MSSDKYVPLEERTDEELIELVFVGFSIRSDGDARLITELADRLSRKTLRRDSAKDIPFQHPTQEELDSFFQSIQSLTFFADDSDEGQEAKEIALRLLPQVKKLLDSSYLLESEKIRNWKRDALSKMNQRYKIDSDQDC